MDALNLVIDIGNSSVKLAWFDGETLYEKTSISSPYDDEMSFKTSLKERLSQHLFASVTACSVVPVVAQWINEVLCSDYSQVPCCFIGGTTPDLPVDLNDYPAESIGADRVVGLSAVRFLYPNQTVILANFGTATTIDVLSSEGKFRGGVIIPGLYTMAKLLKEKTAQLSQSNIETSVSVLGMDSQACLDKGLSFGYKGMLDEIISQMRRELNETNVLVIATGGASGAAQFIFREDMFDELVPDLLLNGLNRLRMVLTPCP